MIETGWQGERAVGYRRPAFGTPELKVKLTYHSEAEGRDIEIPFVVGVLGSFRGDRRDDHEPLGERRFESVSVDLLDRLMRRWAPRISLRVPDRLGEGDVVVDLTFRALDDFHPQAIMRQVPTTAAAVRFRETIVEAKLVLAGRIPPGATPEAVSDHQGGLLDVIDGIVRRHCLGDGEAAGPLDAGPVVARAILAAVSPAHLREAVECLDLLVADIDERLGRQCDAIMHAPAFQRLEALWRGVDLLVRRAEQEPLVEVKILDVGRDDLDHDLSTHLDAADYRRDEVRLSTLFHLIYITEYGQFGGTPFGLLLLDGHLGPDPADMRLAERLATIGAAAHCPVICGAAASMFKLDSYDDLDWDRVDLEGLLGGPEYRDWQALRAAPDSRYLGLVLPQILVRPPYAVDGTSGQSVPYEESVAAAADLLWASGAFAFALAVLGAFIRHRWCVAITGLDGGGVIEGLPALDYGTGEGPHVFRPSIERTISTRRERDLATAGFIPLIQRPGQRQPAFFSAFSVNLPSQRQGVDAVSQRLSARLPYLFAASRVAHYVKANMREQIGSVASLSRFQSSVSRWISQYVAYQDDIDEYLKAERPLRDATVTVFPSDDEPGRFTFLMELQPHFQLEEMGVRLSVGSPPIQDRNTAA